MIDRSSSPTCVKCGRLVPQGAGFCPNCGTQLGDPSFAPTVGDDPVTILPRRQHRVTADGRCSGCPRGKPGDRGRDHLGGAATGADAPTISPTGVVTSLDSPSPRPPVRAGDGPFQAGQQVGPRYTILKLLGIGGMGAVYQAFDDELGVARRHQDDSARRAVGRDRRARSSSRASSASCCWPARSRTSTSSASTTSASSTASST